MNLKSRTQFSFNFYILCISSSQHPGRRSLSLRLSVSPSFISVSLHFNFFLLFFDPIVFSLYMQISLPRIFRFFSFYFNKLTLNARVVNFMNEVKRKWVISNGYHFDNARWWSCILKWNGLTKNLLVVLFLLANCSLLRLFLQSIHI